MGQEGQQQISFEEMEQQTKQMFNEAQKQLNKQIFNAEFQAKQLKNEMVKYKNYPDIMKIYAKQIVQTQKEVLKMHQQIASLQSAQSTIRQAIVQTKINNVLGYVGQYMKDAYSNAPIDQKQAIQLFAMQNEKLAQIMGMTDDMQKDLFEDMEIEKEADEEVDRVINEVVSEKLSQALPPAVINKQTEQQDVERQMQDLSQKMSDLGL